MTSNKTNTMQLFLSLELVFNKKSTGSVANGSPATEIKFIVCIEKEVKDEDKDRTHMRLAGIKKSGVVSWYQVGFCNYPRL